MIFKYVIMKEGRGFVLYRKLDVGEESWYRREAYRLRWYEDNLLLRLGYIEKKENIEKEFPFVKAEYICEQ